MNRNVFHFELSKVDQGQFPWETDSETEVWLGKCHGAQPSIKGRKQVREIEKLKCESLEGILDLGRPFRFVLP